MFFFCAKSIGMDMKIFMILVIKANYFGQVKNYEIVIL